MLPIIKNIKQKLTSGSPSYFMEGLQQFAQISKTQYEANRGQFQFQLKPMIDSIDSGFQLLKNKVKDGVDFNVYFKKIQSNLPPSSQKKYAAVFSRISRQVKKALVQNMAQQFQDQIAQQIEANILNQAVQENDITNMNLKRQKYFQKSSTPIEQSISPYKQIISNALTMLDQNNLPPSVRFLASYAKTQNLIPVGAATEMKGNAYIGLEKVQIGDRIMLVPKQKSSIKYSRVPNLANEINFHANRTMSSWNKFVQHQAELVDFIGNISSQQKRLNYVQNQFKSLNLETFEAQMLATLTYYYVFIPLEKFIRKIRINGVQVGQQSFYRNYSVSNSIKQNPILLSNSQGSKIAQLLLNHGITPDKYSKPSLVGAQILTILGDILTKMNSSQIQKILKYVTSRRSQANSFFITSGISQQAALNFLAVQDFSTVKRKKFMFPDDMTNNQYINIMQKISKPKNQKVKIWDISWGSQNLYCHDYIWNYNK